MANTGFKGIDVRQTGTALVFRALLQTSAGALLGTGTTTVSLQELQSDGTIKSYDFNDNTFKTTALTTATLALTHRPSNNAGTTTGIWTAALSTLTGFTTGAVYVAIVNNTGASPTDQAREFQFGGAEGDLAVTANGTGVAELNTDVKMVNGTVQTARDLGLALPATTPGASGGLLIAGSNAGTTFAFVTSAATSLGSTTMVGGTNSAGLAITGTGAAPAISFVAGTGAGQPAISATAVAGEVFTFVAGGAHNGGSITSGSGATGDAVVLTAASTNGSGLTLVHAGTGFDLKAQTTNALQVDINTIKTQTVTCAAAVTILASVGTAATSTAQTGDSFARIGATGSGLTSLAPAATALSTATWTGGLATSLTTLAGHDPGTTIGTSTYAGADTAGTTTLLTRLSAARAGYMDNLNVGGPVASHADVLAINQSASKHIILQTVAQYEPGETYTVEMRTFSALDGSAVNADTTPTLTANGGLSGNLSGNLSAATNPATGVYRWTYTPGSSPTLEEIRMDGSATIATSVFTMSAYTQTVDFATAVFTSTDKAHLTAVFNVAPANTPNVDSSGRVLLQPTQTGVTIPTAGTVTNPVTVTGTPTVNVTEIAGQTANAAGAVTFPGSIGTSTYAGADTAGTTTLLARVTGPVALAATAVSNVQWTNQLAANLGTLPPLIPNGTAVVLGGATTQAVKFGYGWLLSLNGQNIEGTYFYGSEAVAGTGSGGTLTYPPLFDHCVMGNVNLPPSILDNCVLAATFTVGSAGAFLFANCESFSSSIGSVVAFDRGAAVPGAVKVNMRKYSGSITLKNLQSGDLFVFEGVGALTLDATCSGGSVVVRGTVSVTDNVPGGFVNAGGTLTSLTPAIPGSAMSLVNGAITDATITPPAETAGRPTGFLAMGRRAWEWVTNKQSRNRTTGVVTLFGANGSTVLETRTQSTVTGPPVVDNFTQGA